MAKNTLKKTEFLFLSNEVKNTRFAKPVAWTMTNGNTLMDPNNLSVSRLEKTNNVPKVGPNSLLKVMAGDIINTKVSYYYAQDNINSAGGRGTDAVNVLVNALLNSIKTNRIGTSSHAQQASNITQNIANHPNIYGTLQDWHSPNYNAPQAYLQIMYFDENFNLMPDESWYMRVWQQGNGANDLVMPTQKVKNNGYCFIYLVNEDNTPVFFDNFCVAHERGRMLSDDHYYAFGLSIAGISSKAAGKADNKSKYSSNELQSKEFSDGSGLELYDFNARSYDQQIGRFFQIDPLTDEGGQESWHPYQYCFNNPIVNVDPDGKLVWFLPFIAKFVIGAAIEYGTQVYDNYQSGKSGAEAWKPQSGNGSVLGGVAKIITNGATSLVDPSGGIGKKLLINTASNVVESVVGQVADGGDISLKKTITDVGVMSIASNVKLDASKTVEKLDKSADKLQRVARNNPSARNAVQATEATKTALNAKTLNAANTTATTEVAETMGIKKVDAITTPSALVINFIPILPARSDGTYVKPIIVPKF